MTTVIEEPPVQTNTRSQAGLPTLQLYQVGFDGKNITTLDPARVKDYEICTVGGYNHIGAVYEVPLKPIEERISNPVNIRISTKPTEEDLSRAKLMYTPATKEERKSLNDAYSNVYNISHDDVVARYNELVAKNPQVTNVESLFAAAMNMDWNKYVAKQDELKAYTTKLKENDYSGEKNKKILNHWTKLRNPSKSYVLGINDDDINYVLHPVGPTTKQVETTALVDIRKTPTIDYLTSVKGMSQAEAYDVIRAGPVEQKPAYARIFDYTPVKRSDVKKKKSWKNMFGLFGK